MSENIINDTDNIDRAVGGSVFERFFTGRNEASYVAPKTLFMTANYVNLVAFETSQGLLLVDTGMEEAGEAVMHDLEGWQSPSDDAILVGEVEGVGTGILIGRVALDLDVPSRNALQKRIDLVLAEDFTQLSILRRFGVQ